MVTVQNIVSTINLRTKLKLPDIAKKLPDCQYNPLKFPGLVYRLETGTLLLFRSGKIVCVGAKHIMDAQDAFTHILSKLNLGVKHLRTFKVHLFVGSASLGYKLNLNILYEIFDKKCMYEVEIFPGLVYHIDHITFMIFSTGKVIITGAKTEKEMKKYFKKYEIIFEQCKLS